MIFVGMKGNNSDKPIKNMGVNLNFCLYDFNPIIQLMLITKLLKRKLFKMKERYTTEQSRAKQSAYAPTRIKRFYIGDANGENYITYRELQCFKWLVLGKTADEIAMILNISKRTVDVHCNNIKRKFNCVKLTQVAYKLALAGINNVVDLV